MKIQKINYLNITLNDDEVTALYETISILNRLQDDISNSITLESANTGECIKINELSRVKGILGGLIDSRVWRPIN